ncbi:MAG: hypothetical protein Q7R87_03535 [Nanoarchaeota archaeon]|nr:hypothetical protein [Nanoarchaeota archaeon]
MENRPQEQNTQQIASNKITTIKLSNQTKSRIDHLKRYPRESYEEILIRLLEILSVTRANPERARISLIKLEREHRKNVRNKNQNKKDNKEIV